MESVYFFWSTCGHRYGDIGPVLADQVLENGRYWADKIMYFDESELDGLKLDRRELVKLKLESDIALAHIRLLQLQRDLRLISLFLTKSKKDTKEHEDIEALFEELAEGFILNADDPATILALQSLQSKLSKHQDTSAMVRSLWSDYVDEKQLIVAPHDLSLASEIVFRNFPVP